MRSQLSFEPHPFIRPPSRSQGIPLPLSGTSCIMGTSTLLIGILIRNILKPTRSLYDFRLKSYGSNSGFRVFGDLDLDL